MVSLLNAFRLYYNKKYAGIAMAKPIITLNGLKIVIMLGMLVIILTGVRFAADIIVPLFWRCLLQ